MLVKIANSWSNMESGSERFNIYKEFFSKHGKFEEKEHFNEEKKEKGIKNCEYEIVSHISDIPLEILNTSAKAGEVTFYKPVKAMIDGVIKEELGDRIPQMDGIVNIHLPSSELLSIKEVTFIEDACSNILQQNLDNGFRIIACIPRAGQRRPDYILGRIPSVKEQNEQFQ